MVNCTRAVAAVAVHWPRAFEKNLEEWAENIAGHDDPHLWRVIFGRKLLGAIREEASELEHDIFPGASHVDDVGVDRHTDDPWRKQGARGGDHRLTVN